MKRHNLEEALYGVAYGVSSLFPNTGTYVLMYHSVGSDGPLSVPVREFEWQMRYLKKRYDVISLDSVVARACSGNKRPAACITFDDGFADVHSNALPILDRLALPATFFITTGSIGGAHRTFYGTEPCMSAGQIRDLHARGYGIGAHTVHHPKLPHIPFSMAREEIAGSKAVLESLTGNAVRHFAYPKGRYTDAVKKIAADSGFSIAVTVDEGPVRAGADPFAVPRIAVGRSTGCMRFKVGLSPAAGIIRRFRRIIVP